MLKDVAERSQMITLSKEMTHLDIALKTIVMNTNQSKLIDDRILTSSKVNQSCLLVFL